MQFTKKTFKRQVASIASSLKTQRDNIQDAIVFAVNQVEQDMNFTYLDVLFDTLRPVRTVRMNTVKSFIQAHITNVKYAKASDGKLRWMKAKKGTDCEFTPITSPWYAFDDDGEVKPDIDVASRVHALRKQLEKALAGDGDKRIKAGQSGMAKKVLQALADLDAVKPDTKQATARA